MRWVELVRWALPPLAIVAGVRAAKRRRLVRAVTARLGPLDADGIVAGAGAIALDAGAQSVLLLHGFGDTPQSLRGLAHYLHGLGMTVRVPLLPGHGRSVAAFATSTADEWDASAEAAYQALRSRGGPVAVVGQSMGGALAIRLVVRHPEVASLVLLAPFLSLSRPLELGARWWRLASLVRPVLDSADERSIHDPVARAASRGYGVFPAPLAPQLVRVVRAACADAPRLRLPVRVVQSREDNRITPAGTEAVVRTMGSPEIDLIWRTGAGHVLSVDHGHAEVWALVRDWIERHAVAQPTATA